MNVALLVVILLASLNTVSPLLRTPFLPFGGAVARSASTSFHSKFIALYSKSPPTTVPYIQPDEISLDRLIAQASFTAITTWNYRDEDGNVAKVRLKIYACPAYVIIRI